VNCCPTSVASPVHHPQGTWAHTQHCLPVATVGPRHVGRLLGAPHFSGTPAWTGNDTFGQWNGLLFAGPRNPNLDLSKLACLPTSDFSGYVLDRVMIEDTRSLEDVHRSLSPRIITSGHFIRGWAVCDAKSEVEFGEWYSVADPWGSIRRSGARHGCIQEMHERCFAQQWRDAKQGAIWLTYYPTSWWSGIPTCWPVSSIVAARTETAERGGVLLSRRHRSVERGVCRSGARAYIETAREDEEICLRMTRSRARSTSRSRNEFGPYHRRWKTG